MKTPHTPGPWKWAVESVDPEWAIVTTKGGRVIANVNSEGGVTDAGKPAMMPRDSNARLIAAAPDLLAALQALHEYARAASAGYRNALTPAEDELYTQAHAAITKATAP